MTTLVLEDPSVLSRLPAWMPADVSGPLIPQSLDTSQLALTAELGRDLQQGGESIFQTIAACWMATFDPADDDYWMLTSDGVAVRISEVDRDVAAMFPWQICETTPNHRYVVTKLGGNELYFHRLVSGAGFGEEVDHRSGDTLDNRRQNLRVCSHAENMKNRRRRKDAPTIYKGIVSGRGGWYALLTSDGVKHESGTFSEPREAALAYDDLARIHHGEFARTNFPTTPSPPLLSKIYGEDPTELTTSSMCAGGRGK